MKRIKYYTIIRFLTIAAFLLLLAPHSVLAAELVYTPVNPSFGGSPINGSHLINSATAQNTFKEKKDIIEDFESQLTRRILSSMARKITESVFGEDGLSAGLYKIGDITVEVTEGSDGIGVNITDFSTGGSTTIDIPYY